jgi:hypothetical protein
MKKSFKSEFKEFLKVILDQIRLMIYDPND